MKPLRGSHPEPWALAFSLLLPSLTHHCQHQTCRVAAGKAGKNHFPALALELRVPGDYWDT